MGKKSQAAGLLKQLMMSDTSRAGHGEKWISAAGGFLGILSVLWISHAVLDYQGAAMVVGSMGASAVLLFAVPHGALSQPWPVFGGQVISAFVGVTCAQLLPNPFTAAAAAVGLAIAVMYYLRCIHPPGGATALVAVLGGEGVKQLGYGFVAAPVLANTLTILALAMVFNLPFHWRRYPAALAKPAEQAKSLPGEQLMIAHSDLVYALSQLDSFIDVSEQDLVRIYTLAVHHRRTPVPCLVTGTECEKNSDVCICRKQLGSET